MSPTHQSDTNPHSSSKAASSTPVSQTDPPLHHDPDPDPNPDPNPDPDPIYDSDHSSSSVTFNDLSFLQSPPSPPPPPPTFTQYEILPGLTISARLVGHSPLWGHHVWNAGRELCTYLTQHSERLVRDRAVLELGAGAGLPSLVSWAQGARAVVVTDYPDVDLVENLEWNVDAARKGVEKGVSNGKDGASGLPKGQIVARGYLWGAEAPEPPEPPEVSRIKNGDDDKSGEAKLTVTAAYDTLILGDLLFNHSEHAKLLKSVQSALKRNKDSVALVFFTPYRPWLLDDDLKFFDMARDGGFEVMQLESTVMPEVMFKEDRGDEMLRRTVFRYELRWREEELLNA